MKTQFSKIFLLGLAVCSVLSCGNDGGGTPGKEVCGDSLDNDGDGAIDCEDLDCAGLPECSTPAEICGDGMDNDGDGNADCWDTDCGFEGGVELSCGDGRDNDCDGASDCEDAADCGSTEGCQVQCDAVTCPTGCCSGPTCMPGTTNAACGTGGAACDTCSGSQTCQAGDCVEVPSCDPSTCPTGCCSGTTCMPGNTTAACGTGGAACDTCSGSQTCQAGDCVEIPSCDPSTCPTGCCVGTTCMPGNTDSACGTGGETCVVCSGGQTCQSGDCVTTPTCGPSTCPTGCCSGTTCMPGNTNSACGTGGETCSACSGGQTCQSGDCVTTPTCGPSTCPAGCCSGTTCMPGNTNSACGTGGAACSSCAHPDTCVDHNCMPPDPCGGVTAAGRCVTSTRLEYCSTPTGGEGPSLVSYDCRPGETCQVIDGYADCILTDECYEGDARCANSWQINYCEGSHWVLYACASYECIVSPAGDFCAPDVPKRTVTGYLEYEARGPNASYTDWGGIVNAAAQGFLAVSYNDATGEQFDVDITGSSGDFVIDIPSSPGPYDYILFLTAGSRFDGTLLFAVADPDLPGGPHDVRGGYGANPGVWTWWTYASSFTDGSTITIPESAGSGAARVFDYLRYVYHLSELRWTGDPGFLLVWLGIDTSWNCGACYADWPVDVFGLRFDGQVWLAGGPNQSYWSDPVTTHELGHWAMSTFGRLPNEGGPHCLGVPVPPGMAWSEGWATWFSSDVRDYDIYYDKQEGSFFWFSIDTRQYSSGTLWRRSNAAAGLFQMVDENEISAMMWDLSVGQGLGRDPLDYGLSCPRMMGPNFARGYTRHTWSIDPSCEPTGLIDRGEPAPFFADFLDALVCAGVSRSDIDSVTQPSTYYPYPSGSPLCMRPQTPVVATWGVQDGQPKKGDIMTLQLLIERTGNWPFPIGVEIYIPEGVTLLSGEQKKILDSNPDIGTDSVEFIIAIDDMPQEDIVAVVDSQISGAGIHAEPYYRFGRPEPIVKAPVNDGPHLLIGNQDFGYSISLVP